MAALLAILLGILQGVTEFLPISSSAHLILARDALGFRFGDSLAFDVALHVGTLAAIVVVFRADLRAMAAGILRGIRRPRPGAGAGPGGPGGGADPFGRLAWMIVAASVPAALVGFRFEGAIETRLRTPSVIAWTLVLGGILFLVVERLARPRRAATALSWPAAVGIGVAQALALIPGVSRSGITISAGLAVGLRREEAARFSFLLGTPALFGAGLKKALDLAANPPAPGEWGVLAVGTAAAAGTGWFVVRFLLGYLRGHRLDVFAWYRFALAAAVWLALRG